MHFSLPNFYELLEAFLLDSSQRRIYGPFMTFKTGLSDDTTEHEKKKKFTRSKISWIGMGVQYSDFFSRLGTATIYPDATLACEWLYTPKISR